MQIIAGLLLIASILLVVLGFVFQRMAKKQKWLDKDLTRKQAGLLSLASMGIFIGAFLLLLLVEKIALKK